MPVANCLRYVAFGLFGIFSFAGCTSMPQGVFPMQNMSRVPPPGTGTYNLPANYYGNSAGAAPQGTGQAATGQLNSPASSFASSSSASSGGLQPLAGSLPTTDLVANSNLAQPPQYSNSAGQTPAANPVQSASYTTMGQPNGGFGAETFSAGRFDTPQLGEGLNNTTGTNQPSAASLNWK